MRLNPSSTDQTSLCSVAASLVGTGTLSAGPDGGPKTRCEGRSGVSGNPVGRPVTFGIAGS